MSFLKKFLFAALLFLLPTQLSLHLWPSWSLLYGIRVDYLSPTLYLTDLFVLTLLLVDYKLIILFVKKKKKLVILFLLFASFHILFSDVPPLTSYKVIRIIEYILLALVLFQSRSIYSSVFQRIVPFTLLFVSLLGFAQILNHGSLNGIFYWLGERRFTVDTPGIALSRITHEVSLRPYATLPHPNALAGFVLVAWLTWFTLSKQKGLFFWIMSAFPLLLCIVCESFTVLFGALSVLTLYLLRIPLSVKKALFFSAVILSLLSPIILNIYFSESSLRKNISERVSLSIDAGEVIASRPFLGSGLGTFIPASKNALRQPVHNVPLLVFSETGLLGTFLFLFVLSPFSSAPALSLVFLTSLFDHYWFTIHQNTLLLSIVIGLLFEKLHKFKS